MPLNPTSKKAFVSGLIFLTLGVLIGAFGAHALKAMVSPEKLVTFETGVRYQFYHGLGLLAVGFFQHLFPTARLGLTLYAFVVGIILFSFNCYFYVLSDIKVYAMIVPVGGVLFVLGWISFLIKVLKLR